MESVAERVALLHHFLLQTWERRQCVALYHLPTLGHKHQEAEHSHHLIVKRWRSTHVASWSVWGWFTCRANAMAVLFVVWYCGALTALNSGLAVGCQEAVYGPPHTPNLGAAYQQGLGAYVVLAFFSLTFSIRVGTFPL